MEPDVFPLHSSSPPPLDDDGDGETGSEEDEFGDFGGFAVEASRSPTGFANSTDSPPGLRYPSPTTKPAAHQPKCSFNHPVEESQTTSAVSSESSRGQMYVEGQDCNAESHVHFINGYSERDPDSRTPTASAGGACSPREETGFADFTVFTEQAAHPWCCGFTPLDSTEQWDDRVNGTNSSNGLGERISGPGREVIMDSEPRSHCAYKAKENLRTIEHCEKRDAALVQPSQDHHRPRDGGALDFPSEAEEKEFGRPGHGQKERRLSRHSLQNTEMQEDGGAEEDREDREESISTLPHTLSVYESVSEDLASQCDDLSFEGPSADLEPNVSSLASQDDKTDWDQTDEEEEEEEDEEVGRHMHSDSFVNTSTANLRQSKAEKGFHYCDQSATQETSATSNQPQSGTPTEDTFADFTDCHFEPRIGQGHTADAGSSGNLPPSDSFADFCSAPTREDGDESWAEFKDQRAQEEGRAWTQFREQVSSPQTDGSTEEEQDGAGQHGVPRRYSCQTSLSCRVQQLLLASFPEVEVPAVEGEEEVLSLCALLHARRLPESEEEEKEEEEMPEQCPTSYWIQQEMWWPHQDLHGAVGLQFQWGGSHTNRTLLRCLGVDTRNIVFIGVKKQPVAVPAFALSLGMLEPTKDSVPAVCSPGHTVVAAQAPPGPRDTPHPATDSVQEALPSSQLDWSSRGLSNSQDGCSALNLDYFGPEEESRSCSSSSSSRSNSPPPGVDRELYELTTCKLESSSNGSHMEDTLNRLMSTAEKTSTSVRRPQQDEELSAEAGRVISELPDLSFMQAKVLMFPSTLTPTECCAPQLQ